MRPSLVLGIVVLASGLSGVGCATYRADVGPGRASVLGVAAEVVRESYPQSVVLEESDHVYALGPVEMMGANKSRRQIAVYVRKTYIGSWEPTVSVRLSAEVSEPRIGAYDPESSSSVRARPMAAPAEWQPIQRLVLEEDKIYREIRSRLGA